jgi:hypothetical protein
MRHRIVLLFAATFIIGISVGAWLFVDGPLADHFRSRAEANFGMLAIMIVCISILMGVLVSVWDSKEEVIPRKHRYIAFRRLLHH